MQIASFREGHSKKTQRFHSLEGNMCGTGMQGGGARREARGRGGLVKRALAMSAMPQARNEQMNRKQKVALQIIAAWADRFACVKTAVIFGSVARGDEKPGSDLDLDLQYVDDQPDGWSYHTRRHTGALTNCASESYARQVIASNYAITCPAATITS